MLNNLNILTIITWIIFGFIAGTIAHLIDRSEVKGGYLGTTILGILGAIVGGYVANALLGIRPSGFTLQGMVTAVVGALVLSFIYRMIFRERGQIKTSTGRLK